MESKQEEKLYWLGFSVFNGIGPKRFALLKNYFGSAKKAWEAPPEKLLSIGLEPKLVNNFVNFRQKVNLSSANVRLCENNIECQILAEKNYPENLKKIDNPPFVLYFKGEIKPEDELAIAIVGTRKMSGYGEQVTESLVADLVAAGLTIVSGLARGVDTVAHKTALSAGGRTIGVLACGLDIVYPPENEKLVEEIINGHGAVVSEFPPGFQPVPGNFPARNRVISGLSLGTVVIEGAEDSGALITARHAAEQNREVFAVPGPITSRNSAGPASLIKTGAKLVWDVNDILEELNLKTQNANGKTKNSKVILLENPDEEIILTLIKDETKHIDELVRQSGFDSGKVAGIMTMMEIKGKVRNLGGMVYSINK